MKRNVTLILLIILSGVLLNCSSTKTGYKGNSISTPIQFTTQWGTKHWVSFEVIQMTSMVKNSSIEKNYIPTKIIYRIDRDKPVEIFKWLEYEDYIDNIKREIVKIGDYLVYNYIPDKTKKE